MEQFPIDHLHLFDLHLSFWQRLFPPLAFSLGLHLVVELELALLVGDLLVQDLVVPQHVPSSLPAPFQIVPGDHLDPKDCLQEVVGDAFHHLRLVANLLEVESCLAQGPCTPPP